MHTLTLARALLALAALAVPTRAIEPKQIAPVSAIATGQEITLEACLKTAMESNHRRPASRFAVAVAEAQHRQALAGYWPQLGLKGGYQRMDEAPNFVFPASSMYVPGQTINTPPGMAMVTVPAGVLGPAAVQLPVSFPAQTINTSPQVFPIPAQDVKLMDPDSFFSSLNATWLIYDGGMRRGYREQAKGAVDAAKAEQRRTDLEIHDSVTRMFYGSVLSMQLHQLGKDTLARMEATLNLTETMYKEGSGKVKKTDFLDNKVMVETIRATVALLEKNELMSQAALANTMGLGWQTSVKPAAREIPNEPYAADLEQLASTAYQFNPDWAKLEAGVQALEGAKRTATSGHYPKVALTGELHRWWNDYDAGIASARNKEGASVGVGMEIPLFDGFLTRNKVREARARADKLQEEKCLLKEGIGLMVKDVLLSLNAAQKSYRATAEAMKSAEENRDLNTRAYQNELVETQDVIKAQLVEALMTAQHLKNRFDQVALQSQLNLVVGTEVWKQFKINP
jgi:outer membrane protein TolC